MDKDKEKRSLEVQADPLLSLKLILKQNICIFLYWRRLNAIIMGNLKKVLPWKEI